MAILSKDILQARTFLEDDQVVAIPTETVYGLAANALKENAVKKIYEAKNRPSSNPLIVHIKGQDELSRYAREVPDTARLLTDHFWPGPLTLLLPKTALVPDATTSGSDMVALRMPGHPLTLELLRSLDFPLAAPSANPFGYISPTKPSHVQEQIGDRIPMILDGGACSDGIESTIVGFEGEKVIIYRLGYITAGEIASVLPPGFTVELRNQGKVVAPGMLPYHYSPHTPLELTSDPAQLTPELSAEERGLITFSRTYPNWKHQIVLSESGDLREAAQKLYAALIEMDRLQLRQLYCERFPEEGLGVTLNERLQKAASK